MRAPGYRYPCASALNSELARPCAVTYLSIGEASKIDADVGFGDQTNTEAYGDEGLDNASTDVMTLISGRLCRNKLRHQKIFEFSSWIISLRRTASFRRSVQ